MDLKKETELGKATHYPEKYDPGLLTPIARKLSRQALSIGNDLPFDGWDIWNGYEISWLNQKGKPLVAIGEFAISCNSANIIESKSFKLYLNSLNQTHFSSLAEVEQTIQKDLQYAADGDVKVKLISPQQWLDVESPWLKAECIDDLDVECTTYSPDPKLLGVETRENGDDKVSETLCSHLLKSNCPVTGQPDWASLYITYSGPKIDREGLLQYIVSMRGHQDFHEHCVETIYCSIRDYCQPEKLAVYARYTRRGGLDINPIRFNYSVPIDNFKLSRQ